MFANKYLDKQISCKCATFSGKTTLHLLCKPLILRVCDAHTAVAAASNTQHSHG